MTQNGKKIIFNQKFSVNIGVNAIIFLRRS